MIRVTAIKIQVIPGIFRVLALIHSIQTAKINEVKTFSQNNLSSIFILFFPFAILC